MGTVEISLGELAVVAVENVVDVLDIPCGALDPVVKELVDENERVGEFCSRVGLEVSDDWSEVTDIERPSVAEDVLAVVTGVVVGEVFGVVVGGRLA